MWLVLQVHQQEPQGTWICAAQTSCLWRHSYLCLREDMYVEALHGNELLSAALLPLGSLFLNLDGTLDPLQSLTNFGPIPFSIISTSRPLRHNSCQHLKLEYLHIRNILQLYLYIVIVKTDYKISNLCNSNDSKAKIGGSQKEEKPCVLWIESTHLVQNLSYMIAGLTLRYDFFRNIVIGLHWPIFAIYLHVIFIVYICCSDVL